MSTRHLFIAIAIFILLFAAVAVFTIEAKAAACDDFVVPPNQVTATDRDGDGHDVDDLWAALVDCSAAGGCELLLEPGAVYENVSIAIANPGFWTCTDDVLALAYCEDLKFPNGLAITGQGATVRAPVWPLGVKRPTPIFDLIWQKDLKLRMAGFTLDGRKAEQVGTNFTEPTVSWRGHGISHWNTFQPPLYKDRASGWCFEDLVLKNLHHTAIVLAQVQDVEIRNNAITDVGCDDTLTPCPGISERLPGYGIALSSAGTGLPGEEGVIDALVHHNDVARVVKYSISLKAGSAGTTPGILRAEVVRNILHDTGSLPIFVSGTKDALVAFNRAERTRPSMLVEHAAYFDTFGISVMGHNDNLFVTDNTWSDLAGMALLYQSPMGTSTTFARNVWQRPCKLKSPAWCVDPENPVPWQRGCYNYPAVWLRDIDAPVVWEANEIRASDCYRTLEVTRPAGSTTTWTPVDSVFEATAPLAPDVIFGQAVGPHTLRIMPYTCRAADRDRDGVVGISDFQVCATLERDEAGNVTPEAQACMEMIRAHYGRTCP